MRKRWTQIFEETLLMHIPCTRNIPSRQPSGRTALTQSVSTFVTICTIDNVTSLIRIGCISKECCRTRERVRECVIIGTTLNALFEELISIERYFTLCILHSPTIEEILVTADITHFHTTKEVDDVRIIKSMIPVHSTTKIVTVHLIICLLINTTLW